ncbi:MAG: HD domain-containing protein [Candidatus Micrarchaeota archaeon]
MSEKITAVVRGIVEDAAAKSSDELAMDHVNKVTSNALALARKVGADEEIVELAALLHDLTRIRSHGHADDHHVTGAVEAERILRELGYPEDRVARVKHCVEAHRGSQKIPRKTKEAGCVASADALSHFDSVGYLLNIAYGKGMNAIEANKWLLDKLERGWNKMIPEAKEMARPKYEAAKLLFG